MTNDDIKEAARLVAQIEDLEGLKVSPKDSYFIGKRLQPTRYEIVSVYGRPHETVLHLTTPVLKEIIRDAIAAKKADLNDLRAGC